MAKKKHKVRDAVGKKTKGERVVHPQGRDDGCTYAVGCEDCGETLGVITFDTDQPQHDPCASGLVCGDCATARSTMTEDE